MKIVTGISRLLVGLLFIFSGFIKANDPIGFSYKLVEYYQIMHLDFLISTAVYQAILICAVEIVLGFAVLIGTRMRFTSALLLAMIIFFTFLTGFTAISNWMHDHPEAGFSKWMGTTFNFEPAKLYYMKDCGCFGDAIKLDPWESFLKDLVLLALIIILFIRRKHVRAFFSRVMQTNIIVTLTIISILFPVYCYMFLPVVNFLYWKNGEDVAANMTLPPDAKKEIRQMVFVYKVNGTETEFSNDDVMAGKVPDNAEFVTRTDKVIQEGDHAKIHDFTVRDANGTDWADSILKDPDYKILVISYSIADARKGAWKELSELSHKFVDEDKKKIYALTSSSLEEAEALRHEYGLGFQFYNTDGKTLQSIIRSNPGIILMKGSVVVDQWPSRLVPDIEKVHKKMAKADKKAN